MSSAAFVGLSSWIVCSAALQVAIPRYAMTPLGSGNVRVAVARALKKEEVASSIRRNVGDVSQSIDSKAWMSSCIGINVAICSSGSLQGGTGGG